MKARNSRFERCRPCPFAFQCLVFYPGCCATQTEARKVIWRSINNQEAYTLTLLDDIAWWDVPSAWLSRRDRWRPCAQRPSKGGIKTISKAKVGAKVLHILLFKMSIQLTSSKNLLLILAPGSLALEISIVLRNKTFVWPILYQPICVIKRRAVAWSFFFNGPSIIQDGYDRASEEQKKKKDKPKINASGIKNYLTLNITRPKERPIKLWVQPPCTS